MVLSNDKIDVEQRCYKCNKLLFKTSKLTYGKIETVCNRCKTINKIIKSK